MTRLWKNFAVNMDGFDELIDTIRNGKPIHYASDGSVLSDGSASAGWLFWRLAQKCNVDVRVEEGDIDRELKVLFGGTILVDGSLEEMSSYKIK